MTTCIDLAEQFGREYRIDYEPHKALVPRADWPWLARIRCRGGYVGVQGGDSLVAFTTRRGIAARLRALGCWQRSQGDAEWRGVFHVADLPAVLGVLKPYQRRILSAEQAAVATARLAGAREARLATKNRGVNGPNADATAPAHGTGTVGGGK